MANTSLSRASRLEQSLRRSGWTTAKEIRVWWGTLGGSVSTIGVVECAQARSALSALLDGEDPRVVPRLVSAHVEVCGACRAFEWDAARLREQVLGYSVKQIPDLCVRILVAIGREAQGAQRDARLRVR
jgi:hypothetical protein